MRITNNILFGLLINGVVKSEGDVDELMFSIDINVGHHTEKGTVMPGVHRTSSPQFIESLDEEDRALFNDLTAE